MNDARLERVADIETSLMNVLENEYPETLTEIRESAALSDKAQDAIKEAVKNLRSKSPELFNN
jgi:F0F1-type ATP synthase alpha subunit